MSIMMLKEKGKRVPHKLIEAVCEKAPGGFGLMYCGKDGFNIANSKIEDVNDPAIVIQSLNEVLVGEKVIAHFRTGSMESDIQSNIQPFIAVERKNQTPLIGVAMVGTFSRFERQGKYSPPYNLNEKLIGPLLTKYEVAVGAANILDQAELMYIFDAELENKGSMIVLMDHAGKILKVMKPDHVTHKLLDFGWVSDHCGYKPEQTMVSGKIITDQSGIKVPTKETSQKELLTTSASPIPQGAPVSSMQVAPPQGISTSQLKDWYRDNNAEKDPRTGVGLVPKNWRAKPQVAVTRVSKSQQQRLAGVAAVASDAKSTKVEVSEKSSTWHKPGTTSTPVNEIEAIKGWASESGKQVPSPKVAEQFDQKTPTFSELTGIEIEEALRWSREDVIESCKKWPGIMGELTVELADLYSKALTDIEELTKPEADGTFKDKPEKVKTDVQAPVVEKKEGYVPSWKRGKAA